MTQPAPPIDQELLDAESLAYELAAEAAVTGALSAAVTAAGLTVVEAWTLAAAGANVIDAAAAADVSRAARRAYSRIRVRLAEDLRRWVRGAIELGEDQANQQLQDPVRPGVTHDSELEAALASFERRIRERLDRVMQLLDALPMTRRSHVNLLLARGHQIASSAAADVRWAVNRGVNAGSASVARAAGMSLLWIAERSACLTCLAYSGHVVTPGGFFPPDLTYADKPISLPAVPYPPRHPNCRCRVAPWSGGPGTVDMSQVYGPSALLREARRSVARGWSAYDSQRARLRAADRLLLAGANLPKTVEERARRAVRRGRFGR